MATISFNEFSKGGPVSVVGNEGNVLKQESESGPSFMQGLSRVASTYGKNLKEQAVGGVETAQKSFGMGVDTMQQAQQMPMGTRQEKERASGLASAGAAQIGVGAMSGTIQTVFSPLTAALLTGVQGYKELDQATGGKIQNQLTTLAQAHPELIKGYSDMVTQNPKTAQFVMDSINVLTAGLGGKPALEATKDLTRGLVTGTKESVGKLPPIPPSGWNMADDVLQSGKNLKDSIQLSIAKKNVNPQLESSAERLMKETTQNVEDPIVAYEKYLSQSKESMGDIKVDAPISTVGGKIGDAFMNVVKQRQSVGATLGEELKSVGKLRVSVAEPKSKLLAELSDSGLSYNPKTKQLTSFQGSKFAPEEVSMLNQFVKDVEALGETPTVSQIDNFIAKTRSDLSFAKGKSGVVGTTNAERIIKGNLAGLRESLNPANNGISRLSPYWKANQTYSELSDFLEEGSTFLGKKTQSGDFAKDASVAKSSVQSILNGGKKDWLIKLEGLTGYPALDDSVLALQAMKDAGDFKGLSLLQAMQETGGLPTSKAGFIQKVLDMAVERGEKLIVGTPEEQTRALLQSLKKPQTAKPTTPKTTPKASSGDKANKINQSNSGIQPNTTPTPPKGKGIRGMIDFDEIMKSLIPTKKLVAEAKDAVDELESAISFAKVAKSPQAVVDLRKALAELMTSMGKETVITNSNYKKIIQEADDMVSMLKAHIKNSEAQASNDVIERRFIKNPTTGKLEGSSKKKVVSEDTILYHGSPDAKIINNIDPKQLKPNGELGSGFYLSENESVANNYAKSTSNSGVLKVNIKGLNIFNTSKSGLDGFVDNAIKYGSKEKYIQHLKDLGYDGINAMDKKETVIFPESVNKLKIIQSKLSRLEQEAKKYKSAEDYINNTAKFVHETNAPDIKEFDMAKIGSGQGEAWLGYGVYLTKKGSFKFENYGKNKIETALTPDAKIFEIKDTPDGKWRDNFVEWAHKKHPEWEKSMESWENPKNMMPRDLLKNRGESDFGSPTIIKELRDEGYDGLLQDGELVIYNPKVLKTQSQLKDIWNKANGK